MNHFIQNDWGILLEDEFQKPYFQELRAFLADEYKVNTIFPDINDIFNALQYTPYQNVKVVILGQDPYHGTNQAHGLSFSVKRTEPIPPSLKNIYKELKEDLGCYIPKHGYLLKWAQQGVLLLNTVLTVRCGEAHSHRGRGWEVFTDQIITKMNERKDPVIFLLWGRPAQGKLKLIDTNKHIVLTSPHPSPLSAHRGFFGSSPFSKINNQLRNWGKKRD